MKEASTNTIWALFFLSCVAKRGGGVSCRCVISIKAAEAGEERGQLLAPKGSCDGFRPANTWEPEARGLSNIRRVKIAETKRKKKEGEEGGGRRKVVKEEKTLVLFLQEA